MNMLFMSVLFIFVLANMLCLNESFEDTQFFECYKINFTGIKFSGFHFFSKKYFRQTNQFSVR